MKNLSFSFDHPVNCHAHFFPVNCPGGEANSCAINCGNSCEVVIPVDHLKAGSWKLELDWESNNQAFSLTKDLEIVKQVVDNK